MIEWKKHPVDHQIPDLVNTPLGLGEIVENCNGKHVDAMNINIAINTKPFPCFFLGLNARFRSNRPPTMTRQCTNSRVKRKCSRVQRVQIDFGTQLYIVGGQ